MVDPLLNLCVSIRLLHSISAGTPAWVCLSFPSIRLDLSYDRKIFVTNVGVAITGVSIGLFMTAAPKLLHSKTCRAERRLV